MKYAFLLMGERSFSVAAATIEGEGPQFIGVSSMDQALSVAKKLVDEGVELIELCGAFEEEGARQIIAGIENKAAVGYVVHLPEQEALYNRLFGKASL